VVARGTRPEREVALAACITVNAFGIVSPDEGMGDRSGPLSRGREIVTRRVAVIPGHSPERVDFREQSITSKDNARLQQLAGSQPLIDDPDS
jgi:hypothetical protein